MKKKINCGKNDIKEMTIDEALKYFKFLGYSNKTKYYGRWLNDDEELKQIANICIWKCFNSYDETTCKSFVPYVQTSINNKLLSMRKADTRIKRGGGFEFVSLECDENDYLRNAIEDTKFNIDNTLMLNKIKYIYDNKLTKTEKVLFNDYMLEGKSHAEIGKENNVTRQAINYRINKLRQNVIKYLNEDVI